MASLPFSISSRHRAGIALVAEELGFEERKNNHSNNINSSSSSSKEPFDTRNRMMLNFVMPGSSTHAILPSDVRFDNSYFTFTFLRSLLGSLLFANKGNLCAPLSGGGKGASMVLRVNEEEEGSCDSFGHHHHHHHRGSMAQKLGSFLKGPLIKRMLLLCLLSIFISYVFLLVFIYPPYRYQFTHAPSSPSHGLAKNEEQQSGILSFPIDSSFSEENRGNFVVESSYTVSRANFFGGDEEGEGLMDVSNSIVPQYSIVSYKPDFSVSIFGSDYGGSLTNDDIQKVATKPLLFGSILIAQCKNLLRSIPTINILYLLEILQVLKERMLAIFPFSYFSCGMLPSSSFLSSLPPFRSIEEWLLTFWEDPEDPEDPPFEIVFSFPLLGTVRLSFDATELDSFVIGNPFLLKEEENNDQMKMMGQRRSLFSLSKLSASVIVTVNLSTRFFERSLASIRCIVENATIALLRPAEKNAAATDGDDVASSSPSALPIFDISIPALKTQSLASFEATRGILNTILNRYQHVLIQRTQRLLSRRFNRSLRVATKKISRVMSLGSFLELVVNGCLRHPLKSLATNIKLLLFNEGK